MDNDIINTTHDGERVSSAYAQIYFDDSYCDQEIVIQESYKKSEPTENDKTQTERSDWTSPSDLLIGEIALKPPFTSKTTRGITHRGILSIGDEVLQTEHAKFMEELNELLLENTAAWRDILEHEKQVIKTKVYKIYHDIFEKKRKIMTSEIASFYEQSLQDLENHIRSEIENVLVSVHARIVSNLNVQVKNKMKKEKNILKNMLKTKYIAEEEKVKKYYKLLLQNELHRNNTLVHNAVSERNEAFKAFLQQLEMENITNTMYVMSTERKKCKIKKFIIENYQDTEIAEKLKKIKERELIIEAYKQDEVRISDINKAWEDKVKKILQLFLKFISFSLKLLPEQTTFLLDFEKMMILQLNEMIQKPQEAPSILIEKEDVDNIFKFANVEPRAPVCDTEPIVVTGTLEDPTPPRYESRETLPSDVDLPTIRLQRQFVYAKCHQYEEIKKLLESQRCKCRDFPIKDPSHISVESDLSKSIQPSPSPVVSESSNEPFLIDDINRLHECPVRNCTDWSKRNSFPYLDSYLDYSEEKFKLVQDILGKPPSQVVLPELINPRKIIKTKLPFAPTDERTHTVATQYSQHEDLYVKTVECPCIDNISRKHGDPSEISKGAESKDLNSILTQRRNSIRALLHQHSEILKMFTDECFDFVL